MTEPDPSRSSDRPILFAFGSMAVLLCAVAVFAAATLHRLVSEKDAVILEGEELAELEHVRATTEREARVVRAWLLTPSDESMPMIDTIHRDVDRGMQILDQIIEDPESRRLLEEVEHAEHDHRAALARLTGDLSQGGGDLITRFESELVPVRVRLDAALDALLSRERAMLHARASRSQSDAQWALGLLAGAAGLSMLAGVGLAFILRGAFRIQAQQREELQRHIERTESANRDLDAFAGRIAHDLRNALAPATLAISRLRKAELGPLAPQLFRTDAALKRSLRVLDSLLAFSRAAARSDASASCEVREVLDGVLEEVEPLRAEVDATVTVEARGGLCAGTTDALLHVLVANLVGNALKYLRDRPVRRLWIRVVEEPGDRLRLSVEDTGPGVPKDKAEQIFEAFYRVPGQSVVGSGIGLATVKRIAEAHGGSVRVTRGAEGGARFEVTLPAAQGELELHEALGPRRVADTRH